MQHLNQNPPEIQSFQVESAVTRGHCHVSLAALRTACRQFIPEINANPETVVDRLSIKFDLDPEYEAKLLVST